MEACGVSVDPADPGFKALVFALVVGGDKQLDVIRCQLLQVDCWPQTVRSKASRIM